jgi:predicted regulator of Ras-like GTPase activity (Roadblock/LC7/MglB family)
LPRIERTAGICDRESKNPRGCGRFAAVEPAQALADLTEISTQLESAVLAGADGSVVASTLPGDERAKAIAANALALLEGARNTANGSRAPTQVQAATREGCVFVVRDDRHVLAAVTGPDPTVGLVFYDLKTALRMVDEEPEKPKPKRRRTTKKAEEEKAAEADA